MRFCPRLDDNLPASFDRRPKDCVGKLLGRDAQEVANFLDFGWGRDTRLFRPILTKLDISDVKNDTDDPEYVILLFVGEADRPESRL